MKLYGLTDGPCMRITVRRAFAEVNYAVICMASDSEHNVCMYVYNSDNDRVVKLRVFGRLKPRDTDFKALSVIRLNS